MQIDTAATQSPAVSDSFELWSAEVLQKWVTDGLRAVGMSGDALELTCGSIVEASLTGVDSHGVLLLPLYMRRIREGGVKPDVVPTMRQLSAALSLVDGQSAPGHLSMDLAVRTAQTAAEAFGVGVAGVNDSNHVGMLAFFARRIAKAGFASILLTNTAPSVSNYAGHGQAIGNNAFCLCLPRPQMTPVISDNAVGVVACGKIRWRRALGLQAPLSYGLTDRDGTPTSDPTALDEGGGVAPFGAHKGWGIGIMIDLLTAGLWGGTYSRSVTRQRRWQEAQSSSQTVIVLSGTPHSGEAAERLHEYLKDLAGLPSTDGRDGHALLPGEREELVRAERVLQGIPVPRSVIDDVRQLLG